MPKVDPLLLFARDLRARSAEVLVKAETMQDPDGRQKMREVAAAYARLARRLERSPEESRQGEAPTVTFTLCQKRDAEFHVGLCARFGGPCAPAASPPTPLSSRQGAGSESCHRTECV